MSITSCNYVFFLGRKDLYKITMQQNSIFKSNNLFYFVIILKSGNYYNE